MTTWPGAKVIHPCVDGAQVPMANRCPPDGGGSHLRFADRLNRLFDGVYPPGRGPYANYEVVEVLRARGYRLSPAYLSQLRTGRRTRPSRATTAALSEFFAVPPGYLLGADEPWLRYLDDELWWAGQFRDPQVRHLTAMIMDLPPHAQRALLHELDCAPDTADACAEPSPAGRWAAS